MKFYFLSSRPCALKLGGVYFGLVDDFARSAEISLNENVFVEFIPENAPPITFFITEQIRFTPPKFCEVYLLKNAVAIYARDFFSNDLRLTPILQQSLDESLVTVFFQGCLQVAIESKKGFFVHPLPNRFEPTNISFHSGLIFLEGKRSLIAFTLDGRQVFYEQILTYSFENERLNATLPLLDSKKRYADGSWVLSEDGVKNERLTILQAKQSDEDLLPHELLAYAFFESVLIGADYVEFLSPDLRKKAPVLKDFLGDFKEVLPTEEERSCDLVYPKGERLFEVKRFTVEVENGLITDLKG